VLPEGAKTIEPSALEANAIQEVRQLGHDTMMCANVLSAPVPVRVHFAIRR
jgi:hypothetical protein